MSKGHLEHEEIIEAFSKLMLSEGKPSFFHLALIASEVNIFKGYIPSVIGIALSLMFGNQLSLQSSTLNFAEKAPIYETN